MTDSLMDRARALGLHGLVAHWDEVAECDWLTTLIAWEEEEKRARSLKRRLADARLGEFKPLADSTRTSVSWLWPTTASTCSPSRPQPTMRSAISNSSSGFTRQSCVCLASVGEGSRCGSADGHRRHSQRGRAVAHRDALAVFPARAR